jgi:hypothetical protein
MEAIVLDWISRLFVITLAMILLELVLHRIIKVELKVS